MRSILKYLKPYRRECICAPFLKMLEVILELLSPLIISSIIDTGISGKNEMYIVRQSLILLLFGVLGLIFSLAAQYFAASAAAGFVCTLRHEIFLRIQKMSYTRLDSVGVSSLITRMTNDVEQLQTGINLALRLLMRSPVVVFGAMTMAFFIDFRSALIFAGTIPLLSAVIFGIMLGTMPLYQKVQSILENIFLRVNENLSGIRPIRAFALEQNETDSFASETDALMKAQRHVGHIASLLNPLTYLILNAAIILLIYTGAIRVKHGALTQGTVIALYNYMSQILIELVKLADLIITMTRAAASGRRISECIFCPCEEPDQIYPEMDKKGTKKSSPKGDLPLIEFEHVYFKYSDAGGDCLTDLSFKVYKGETVAIIGGTGSGKTSLVSLIPRFYEPSKGNIKYMGNDIKFEDPKELRMKIGTVPQKAVLFRGTIRENLLWGKNSATDDELYKAARAAQAMDVIDSKGGLDGQIEQDASNLSGGQRQRLTIARALLRKPEILILDDSSSALDYATALALQDSLSNIQDMTKFVTSQRIVLNADKIIVLENGHISGMGTHEELINSCRAYREIANP